MQTKYYISLQFVRIKPSLNMLDFEAIPPSNKIPAIDSYNIEIKR